MSKELDGLTFVVTGTLLNFTRDEISAYIGFHGGKVGDTVSSKTDYLIVGDKPGGSKLSKAEKFQTKIISLDNLIDLVVEKGKK